MIRSAAEVYQGHNVGVIYINEKVVMRLYSSGKDQSPYGRAIEIVKKIRDSVKNGASICNIKIMNGNTAVVGILGNREVFRIYEDDVRANGSMPESLARTWKNNIETASLIKLEDIKKEIESSVKKVSDMTSDVSGEILQGILDKRALDVTSDLELENIAKSSFFASPGVSGVIVACMFFMMLIFILLVALVFLQVKKVRLQKSGIVGHASSEELENVISHLITEIDEKSEKLTFEFKQKMNALQDKLEEAEVKMTAFSKQNDDLVHRVNECQQDNSPKFNETIKEEKEVIDLPLDNKNEPVVVKLDIARAKHTKQDIIFEMFDNDSSVTDIAKKLGIGTGEVQLILDLRR